METEIIYENIDIIKEMVMEFGMKLIYAIVVLIIGLWAIKLIMRGVSKLMAKRHIDASLIPFLKSMLNMLLKTLLAISVLSMLGIEMTSFIALLGAAGLAVGMALSGTLQNFAGGVMILIFRPFNVGDFIEAQGYKGTVKEIQIFITILTTPDNKTIIIPNGPLSNNSLINYSSQTTRRIDWTFGIGYGDKTEDAQIILMEMMIADDRILLDPEPFVGVSELGDSSVNLATRAWVKPEDYWNVFFDMNQKVYNQFNERGINIPYPQMDIHLHSTSPNPS
jgi:small conductance mechanosensitive channel